MAASHGGRVTRFPTSVHEYLRELYRNAATALEQEGRIEEAAFVHADLLDEVGAALSLLERHGRIALAADLADARSDDAVAAVRLLWKAGRHQRALDVARARGAFAAAIVRLNDNGDGDAARELRSAWADALRDSGDYLGAVEVLWADAGLHEAAAADIEVGLVLGGAVRTHLLPYALANGPRPDLAEEAIALARGGDPETPHQTIEFVRSLSEHKAHDLALDRRLSSEVLRLLVDADRSPTRDHALARRYSGKLSGRADPVLRADLSKVTTRLSTAPIPTLVAMTAQAGTLPIRDVAPLDSGDLLVASGSLGLRLFSPQGRLRARWDVPSERLSVVDHGGGVVVAASAGTGTWSTHRLDLATRRIRPWVTVRAQRLLDSFDGLTLGMVEEEGTLGFLDTSSDRARIVWRELRDVGRAVDVARSGKEMAAVVALSDPPPGHTGLEMWWWSLPGMTLRGRRAIPWPEGQAGVTADGTFWQLEQAVSQDDPAPSDRSLSWLTAYEGQRQRPLPPGELTLLTTGNAHVLLRRPGSADTSDLSVELRTGPWDHPDLTVEIAGCQGAGVRLGRGLACVWDPDGRVLVADLTDRHVLCNLALGV